MASLLTKGRAPLGLPTIGCSPMLVEINESCDNRVTNADIWYKVTQEKQNNKRAKFIPHL